MEPLRRLVGRLLGSRRRVLNGAYRRPRPALGELLEHALCRERFGLIIGAQRFSLSMSYAAAGMACRCTCH